MTIITGGPIVEGSTPQTFADLKSTIANFMARNDLTADIPSMVRLCEYRLNRELVGLEIDTILDDAEIGDSTIDVSDLAIIEAISLHIVQTEGADTPITKGRDFPRDTTSGRPLQWEYIDGYNAYIQFDRPIDQAYDFRLRHTQRFQLVEDGATNWLLTNHEDVYLAAALVWGGGFTQDFPLAAVYKSVLDEGIRSIRSTVARRKLSVASVDRALLSRRSCF